MTSSLLLCVCVCVAAHARTFHYSYVNTSLEYISPENWICVDTHIFDNIHTTYIHFDGHIKREPKLNGVVVLNVWVSRLGNEKRTIPMYPTYMCWDEDKSNDNDNNNQFKTNLKGIWQNKHKVKSRTGRKHTYTHTCIQQRKENERKKKFVHR